MTPQTQSVSETPERMVFLVRSDSAKSQAYRVDILANDGAGRCSCTDFGTRRQPALDRGEPAWTAATSCKHTRRAAWHVIRTTFKALAAQEDRPNRKQKH